MAVDAKHDANALRRRGLTTCITTRFYTIYRRGAMHVILRDSDHRGSNPEKRMLCGMRGSANREDSPTWTPMYVVEGRHEPLGAFSSATLLRYVPSKQVLATESFAFL